MLSVDIRFMLLESVYKLLSRPQTQSKMYSVETAKALPILAPGFSTRDVS